MENVYQMSKEFHAEVFGSLLQFYCGASQTTSHFMEKGKVNLQSVMTSAATWHEFHVTGNK